MLALFLKVPKMWHPKGLIIDVFDNLLSFDVPSPGRFC